MTAAAPASRRLATAAAPASRRLATAAAAASRRLATGAAPVLRRWAALAAPAVLLALAGASPAAAVALSFLPTSSSHLVGSTLDVDVRVSGLGAAGAPSVGEFDLDVSFDPGVLMLDDVSFGAGLGAPGVDAAVGWSLAAPGRVSFAELSLLGASALDALQSDAFAVATLSFTALASGQSLLEFEEALVGDASGAPLTISPLASAEVLVVVPEPASLALLGLGLGALGVLARKERNARPDVSDTARRYTG